MCSPNAPQKRTSPPTRARLAGAALVLLLISAACGGEGALDSARPDALAAVHDRFEHQVPRGIYVPVARPETLDPTANTVTAGPGEPPLPLFLNGLGGTYNPGWDDSSQNISSIVEYNNTQLDAFGGGAGTWADVVDCVQEQFAPFNVMVTDVEPAGGNYVEAVIGDHPSKVGLPNGVGGVAPIDSYQCSLLEDAIVFVFTENLPNDAQIICEVAAQEIAHALSLDHELLCEDPMTYLNGCGDKWFQDVNADCGEYSVRECICDRPYQNSVQIMLDKLGAADGSLPDPADDTGPPEVDIVSPSSSDATMAANSEIQIVANIVDDSLVSSVALNWEWNDSSFGCPGSGNGWSCSKFDTNYTWTLNVGDGTRDYQVQAQDYAGNVTVTDTWSITLTDGGLPEDPPVDDAADPEVSLVSPSDGAQFEPLTVIEVVATASDDVGIANVALEWDWSGDEFGCPYNGQAVSCEINGSTYTWNLYVGNGERTFRVRATDLAGNTSVTSSRTIEMTNDPIEPPPADDVYEDNDTFDTGTPVACGVGLMQLQHTDTDWFQVTVGAGYELTVDAISTSGIDLDLRIASGPNTTDVLAEANSASESETLSVVSDIEMLGVRVTSDGVGAYEMVVTCNEAPPSEEDPGEDPVTPDPGDDPADPGDAPDPDDGDPGTGPQDPDTLVPPDGDGDGQGGQAKGDDDASGASVSASGCSATHTPTETPAGWLALLGFALVGLLGRRRRR